MSNTIQWYESRAYDAPELRSPQPCPRGIYCQYKLPDPETKELKLACCRMVHPGEEGNGRRLFPARTRPDGREQPACVRLTGNAGFYERSRLKQPWRIWAAARGISLPPADVPWVQVLRGRLKNIAYTEAQMSAFSTLKDYADAQETAERRADAQSAATDTWPSLQSPIPKPIYFEVPPALALTRQLNMTYGFSAVEEVRQTPPGLTTPLAALAKGLIDAGTIPDWTPILQRIIDAGAGGDVEAELTASDKINIEAYPWHFAQCVQSEYNKRRA